MKNGKLKTKNGIQLFVDNLDNIIADTGFKNTRLIKNLNILKMENGK
jgi:hypothetical protein